MTVRYRCAVIEGAENHEFAWLQRPNNLHTGDFGNAQEVSQLSDSQDVSDGTITVGGSRFSLAPLKHCVSEEWIVQVKNDYLVAFWHLSGLSESSARVRPACPRVAGLAHTKSFCFGSWTRHCQRLRFGCKRKYPPVTSSTK